MAKAHANSSAAKRLLQELKQLKEEPIVGINAEPLGHDDLFKWYGIVVGIEGSTYAGIPIRFSLEFSSEYPREAPKAYFDTEVPYEGSAAYRDSTGRLPVCLNIFVNFENIHTKSEGWKPSYTVQTILLSMQALMLSDMLSKDKDDIQLMTESAKIFKCPITGHDGADRSKWFPQVILDQSEANAVAKISGRIVFNILRDFYICSANKCTAKTGALMGYGVCVDNARIGDTISSCCEYFSQEAFQDGTIRSLTNKPYEFWIPIVIYSNQWNKIKPIFFKAVNDIAAKINLSSNSDEGVKVFKICSSIMNSLIVKILNNKGNTTANDKFINGYFAFYRLLVEYSKTNTSMARMANKRLKAFIGIPENRGKEKIPNLGELLIFLLITTKCTWAQLAQTFITEYNARNDFWYIIGNNKVLPQCQQESEFETTMIGRSNKICDESKLSRNLVMFQVRFAKVAKELDLQIMDSNFGLAPDDLRYELRDLYLLIETVDCRNDFLSWLEIPPVACH